MFKPFVLSRFLSSLHVPGTVWKPWLSSLKQYQCRQENAKIEWERASWIWEMFFWAQFTIIKMHSECYTGDRWNRERTHTYQPPPNMLIFKEMHLFWQFSKFAPSDFWHFFAFGCVNWPWLTNRQKACLHRTKLTENLLQNFKMCFVC